MRHLVTVSALLLLAGVSPAGAQGATQSKDPTPYIETLGSAQRRVVPDRASVYLSIETKAESASVAASRNARIAQAVLDTLRKAALDSAITTASLNVGPNYEPRAGNNEPLRVGYVATTTLRIRLTKVENVGRVIDVGLAKGATGVGSVTFESSVAETMRRGALGEAAAAARRDAEELSRALGGTLGPLISVTSIPQVAPFYDVSMGQVMRSASVGVSVNTPYTPSEIVIAARVLARFQFVER